MFICLVALLAGMREHTVSRGAEPFTWLSADGQGLIEIISRLNPDDPDPEYLRAMHALANGDEAEFSRRLQTTLASGAKHNEQVQKFHAEYLLLVGAETQELNAALNRWNRNFPFSDKSFMLPLAAGPRSAQQGVAFERELARIPWIADSRVERVTNDAGTQWRVVVTPRRGRPIDVRDVGSAARLTFAN